MAAIRTRRTRIVLNLNRVVFPPAKIDIGKVQPIVRLSGQVLWDGSRVPTSLHFVSRSRIITFDPEKGGLQVPQIEWKPDENEPADFNFGRYDIGAAKRILQADPKRKLLKLQLAGYRAMLKMLGGVSYAGIDLTLPVIVVQIGAGLLPIDGWSRIAEATSQGLTTLPAVRLTTKEARLIRVG